MPNKKNSVNLESIGDGISYILAETRETIADLGAFFASFTHPKHKTAEEKFETLLTSFETNTKDTLAGKIDSIGSSLKETAKEIHKVDLSSTDGIGSSLAKLGDTLFHGGLTGDVWTLVKEELADE